MYSRHDLSNYRHSNLDPFLSNLFLFPLIQVTFPLDITKTRLQVQGEVAAHLAEKSGKKPPPYRGMIRTAIGIGR